MNKTSNPYVGCEVWRARVQVVGLGHWFDKFGLRVSFGDASSSFFARNRRSLDRERFH
jgi:hypothetical protein